MKVLTNQNQASVKYEITMSGHLDGAQKMTI